MITPPRVAALLLAGVTAITVQSRAHAQGLMLEEVVVTAQKRAQNLQDVPIAILAMTGEKIDDFGITSLEEITRYMPNVTINNGAATPNLYIRGIGSGTNSGFEQSVGLYIDGVYAGRAPLAAVPTTMDLERIEVLKGPQGILFGKNTIGGAINITSAKPTSTFEGMAEALYEAEHNEQQYNLVVSGPLTDTLAARLAVRYDSIEGWWDNVTNGEQGPDQSNWYLRGSLRWNPADTVEVDAKYEFGDFDRGASPVVVYQSDLAGQQNFAGTIPFPVVSDEDKGAGDVSDDNNNQTNVFALTVNWGLDFAQLTSISAYSGYDVSAKQNADLAATASFNRTFWETYDQYSQELRLVSPGNESFDWIVGGYYQASELDISNRVDEIDFQLSGPLSVPALVSTTGNPPSQFDQDSESWAAFGQVTWNITDELRFSAGLRYNEETKDLDKATYARNLLARAPGLPELMVYADPANNQLIEDLRSHNFPNLGRDEKKWTYSGTAQWDASDDAMLYANISTGFKGGGYDEAYSGSGESVRLANPFTGEPTGETVPGNDASILDYEDETVVSYEIGAKMRLLDGAAELNLAVFRMEYDNLQTSSLVGDVFKVGNAGEAVSEGIELDGRWLLTQSLTLGGAVAYLNAHYDDFTGATCTIPQVSDPATNPGCLREDGSNIEEPFEEGGQDLTDESLLFAPDWSASLFVQHVMPLSAQLVLLSGIDINYTDEFYSALDLDPNTQHDSATKVNARIALASEDETWSVAVIGKNLTDVSTHRWRNDVLITDSKSYFGIADRPRSIAVQLRYRF
jgi:iron complex outermembrane receptor protein